jgi:uncharacterized protein YndB with AHSA1/START domain
MTNPPNGQLVGTADGNALVVSRTFRAPIEDVWASITEPDRTAGRFGTWTGDGAPGRMIKVQIDFEDHAPWLDKRIDACDPPRRLALSNESGNMRVELLLSHREGEPNSGSYTTSTPPTRSAPTDPAGSTTWTCWWQRETTCPHRVSTPTTRR